MRTRLSLVALAFLNTFVLTERKANAQVIFEGHTYLLTLTATNWGLAEGIAVSIGGHLATVNTQAENDFLTSTFCNVSAPFWIGFTDQVQEGQWRWTSGEPVTYTNWHPGEPNNDGGLGHWAAINWHFARGDGVQFRGDWNDTPIGGTTGFAGNTDGPYFGIVEIVGVPEPTSMFLLGAAAASCLVARCRKVVTRHDVLPRDSGQKKSLHANRSHASY